MFIAIIQLCSGLGPRENLLKIQQMITQAKKEQPKLAAVFLPEVFYSMSNGEVPSPYLVENQNEHFLAIQNLAKSNNLALLGGSAASLEKDKIKNRAYNFSAAGELLSTYDKIHLFKVQLSGKEKSLVVDEGKIYTAGNSGNLFTWNDWKVANSICFDLRFSELYRYYYQEGAELITIPAAFTIPTGKAHWESLVRARAIETQAYIIASAQWGIHNERISTYGHSMVVDPWGRVLTNLYEGEGYAVVELDKTEIKKVKSRISMD